MDSDTNVMCQVNFCATIEYVENCQDLQAKQFSYFTILFSTDCLNQANLKYWHNNIQFKVNRKMFALVLSSASPGLEIVFLSEIPMWPFVGRSGLELLHVFNSTAQYCLLKSSACDAEC